MRTIKKKTLSILLVFCMLFSMVNSVFAANYEGDAVVQGLEGIQPEDTLTLPDNTVRATLTAMWGVNVIFEDWDETELKSDTVAISDTETGNSRAPQDPTRDGWMFTGWERADQNGDTNVSLSDDGKVTNITGPGPIVFIAKYAKNTTPPTPPTDPKVGNLTVSKTISGNAADSSKAFDFTVTLGDTSINGTYGDMSFTNGVATFTLKGGESKTATALPAGASYTVTEADYSADGYVTTKSGDTGTITDSKTATAAFTNTKNTTAPTPTPTPKPADPTTPKTGDNSNLTLWIMLLVASVAGMAGTAIWSKKRKKMN